MQNVEGHVQHDTEEHGDGCVEKHQGPGRATERNQESVEGADRCVGHEEEGRSGGEDLCGRAKQESVMGKKKICEGSIRKMNNKSNSCFHND